MTVPNPPAKGSNVSPPGKTKLITDKSGPHIDNGVQETDIRLALQRGLAEYLEQLSYSCQNGRTVRFAQVTEEWAEPEENAKYPAAAIYTQGPGVYEARALNPALNPKQRLPPPDNRYLIIPSEYTANLVIECFSTDNEERTAIIQMMESALNPSFWRSGFVLELPHYFNIRATYVLKESTIPDDAEDALSRRRRVLFNLTAQGPLVTLFSFPDAKPRHVLESVGPDIDVVVTTSTS